MMLSSEGRFYTLDCSKLPGGRGNGEAIRTFIDMPPEADIAVMFVHVPAAWMGIFVYATMAGASLTGLVFRHPLADVAAKSAAGACKFPAA